MRNLIRFFTGNIFVIVFLALISISVSAADIPRLSRELLHATVRIEAQSTNGKCVGTGFFYSFKTTNGDIPVIVTCSHVINGAKTGVIYFASAGNEPFQRKVAQEPLVFQNFESLWLKHPDGKTDLAVMPIAPYMRQLADKGVNLDFIPFDDSLLPSESELKDSSIFVSIKMIGYPIGIWDAHNNLPVVRTGMTATDLSVDYNGEPEFLVDTAVFPGSSGSPILYADEGTPAFIGGAYIQTPSKLLLLGIVAQEFQFPATGGVQVVNVPTAFDLKATTMIPANLAIVIKSSKLREFEPELEAIIESQKNSPQK
jgi:Trypsin-like peptidase domain